MRSGIFEGSSQELNIPLPWLCGLAELWLRTWSDVPRLQTYIEADMNS